MEIEQTSVATAMQKPVPHVDREYDELLQRMQLRMHIYGANKTPLFTTDAEGLFDAYLAALPAEFRQYHTCNTCRHFMERYGALAVINDQDGRATAALWPSDEDVGGYYAPAILAVRRLVAKARITGVFLSSDISLGQLATGEWTHFAVLQEPGAVHRHRLLTAFQAAAEKKEDYGQVQRALAEFSQEHVQLAVGLLKSDALFRSEKVLGQAEWLLKLHGHASVLDKRGRENLIWLEVAKAPAGFCHPRSSMIGTLLDDIASGMTFAKAEARFREKMHPLKYQRPQAEPTAGAIQQAEKIFGTMGLASALRRRFARLEDIEALWKPPAPKEPASPGGVFGHLQPKGAAPKAADMSLPATVMTFAKFRAEVMPELVSAEALVPTSGNFFAFITAADAEAQPILQWDREERRNPVSVYLYHGGSFASNWGLVPGYVRVTAIADRPYTWFGAEPLAHHGHSACFVLDGAVDKRDAGLALFPETLRSELHGVRSVIEAHSRTGKIEGRDQASACGLMLGLGNDVTLRVRTKDGLQRVIRIDRWD